ncbi:hypothetical protein [Psychrobacter sp. CAL346-MNA-CIBAN-0220]|uniref:hypothetical protein n=1 Tax=Psychrobacter sp. CAL346-MNA-CIBAN-0220 TaxID=3140457 RepID=UPI00331F6158
MINLFGNSAQACATARPTLPSLDDSLYPFPWQSATGQVEKDMGFSTPQALLMAIINAEPSPTPQEFWQHLYANDIYQEWINFTVFGRYIQRSFAAFYQQSEDSFNMDIPALFRHELMRHAQYLPLDQILFVAGNISKNARREKLLTTTLNPATAVISARTSNQSANKSALTGSQEVIVNQIWVKGRQVLGFPIRHNKRTSERTRNEVLILNFNDLRLVDEQSVGDNMSDNKVSNEEESNTAKLQKVKSAVLLRYYELR